MQTTGYAQDRNVGLKPIVTPMELQTQGFVVRHRLFFLLSPLWLAGITVALAYFNSDVRDVVSFMTR